MLFTLDERIAAKRMAYKAGSPDIVAVVRDCTRDIATVSDPIIAAYGQKIGFTTWEMRRFLEELDDPC